MYISRAGNTADLVFLLKTHQKLNVACFQLVTGGSLAATSLMDHGMLNDLEENLDS